MPQRCTFASNLHSQSPNFLLKNALFKRSGTLQLSHYIFHIFYLTEAWRFILGWILIKRNLTPLFCSHPSNSSIRGSIIFKRISQNVVSGFLDCLLEDAEKLCLKLKKKKKKAKRGLIKIIINKVIHFDQVLAESFLFSLLLSCKLHWCYNEKQ